MGRRQAARLLAPPASCRWAPSPKPSNSCRPTPHPPTPRRPAPNVSPLDYRQQTVALTGDYVIVRNGRLNRRVKAIHTSHIQELTYRRGPISQALGLATVGLDLVQGPVRMDARNLTLADAAALLARLRSRQLPDFKPPR